MWDGKSERERKTHKEPVYRLHVSPVCRKCMWQCTHCHQVVRGVNYLTHSTYFENNRVCHIGSDWLKISQTQGMKTLGSTAPPTKAKAHIRFCVINLQRAQKGISLTSVSRLSWLNLHLGKSVSGLLKEKSVVTLWREIEPFRLERAPAADQPGNQLGKRQFSPSFKTPTSPRWVFGRGIRKWIALRWLWVEALSYVGNYWIRSATPSMWFKTSSLQSLRALIGHSHLVTLSHKTAAVSSKNRASAWLCAPE